MAVASAGALQRILEDAVSKRAFNAAGIAHKLDGGVPLDQLGRFLDAVPEVVRGAGGERPSLGARPTTS